LPQGGLIYKSPWCIARPLTRPIITKLRSLYLQYLDSYNNNLWRVLILDARLSPATIPRPLRLVFIVALNLPIKYNLRFNSFLRLDGSERHSHLIVSLQWHWAGRSTAFNAPILPLPFLANLAPRSSRRLAISALDCARVAVQAPCPIEAAAGAPSIDPAEGCRNTPETLIPDARGRAKDERRPWRDVLLRLLAI